MKILLTNDDGIDAEGLQCLVKALEPYATCYVVAPDRGRSCCGHGVTTDGPMDLVSCGENQWSLTGTPADCVRVALLGLQLQPDLVISGVNQGGNLGVDIWYSGTVAGAREARLLGCESIAISQYMRRDIARDWNVTAQRALTVLMQLWKTPLGPGAFRNINLPALPIDQPESPIDVRHCSPEIAPLCFEYQPLQATEASLAESPGSIPARATVDKPISGQCVLYRGNYQARPRTPGSDVDLCFSGFATVSHLSAMPFEDQR